MNKFTIETQWQLYLKKVGLREEILPEDQRVEMKRTFFGACGQMLFLMRDDISALPEDKGITILNEMKSEIGKFWIDQSNRKN